MIESVDSPEVLRAPCRKPLNVGVLGVARWGCVAGVVSGLMLVVDLLEFADDRALAGGSGLVLRVGSDNYLERNAVSVAYLVITLIGWGSCFVASLQLHRRLRSGLSGFGFGVVSLGCLFLLPSIWLIAEGAWGPRSKARALVCALWFISGLTSGSLGPLSFNVHPMWTDWVRITCGITTMATFGAVVVALGIVDRRVRTEAAPVA